MPRRPRTTRPHREVTRLTTVTAPMDVLLSHAVLELTRAAERLEPSLNIVRWADFLRVAEGSPQRTLHLTARVSRRVIANSVKLSIRVGHLTVDDAGLCHLTPAGQETESSWRSAVARACADFEAGRGAELRRSLTPVVAALDLELPHYPCPYRTPDPSITGGRPHGADWRPVARDHRADTTAGLSILALLSQALTAYSIEYERRAGPLVWGVYLARHPDRPLPFRGTFERHRFRAQVARDAYLPTTTAIESRWQAAHGDALRTVLESVEASLAPGHADHPAVVFDPRAGFCERSSR